MVRLSIGLCVALVFVCGWVGGTVAERCHWVSKARPENRTPNCVAGRFYYVVLEDEFCRDWQPRAKE